MQLLLFLYVEVGLQELGQGVEEFLVVALALVSELGLHLKHLGQLLIGFLSYVVEFNLSPFFYLVGKVWEFDEAALGYLFDCFVYLAPDIFDQLRGIVLRLLYSL